MSSDQAWLHHDLRWVLRGRLFVKRKLFERYLYRVEVTR